MLFLAVDNPAPSSYLLISGDRDFSNALHQLRMDRNFTSLLMRRLRADGPCQKKRIIKGLGLLALHAHYPKIKPPPCNVFDAKSQCTQLRGGNACIFALHWSLFDGYWNCWSQSWIAITQFEDDAAKEVQHKSTFLYWFLLTLCLGGAVSLTVFVYVGDNKGWDWGFSLSTLAMLLGILLLLSGLPRYRIHVVRGSSAITEIIQVFFLFKWDIFCCLYYGI